MAPVISALGGLSGMTATIHSASFEEPSVRRHVHRPFEHRFGFVHARAGRRELGRGDLVAGAAVLQRTRQRQPRRLGPVEPHHQLARLRHHDLAVALQAAFGRAAGQQHRRPAGIGRRHDPGVEAAACGHGLARLGATASAMRLRHCEALSARAATRPSARALRSA
jgi:hypothetical protein